MSNIRFGLVARLMAASFTMVIGLTACQSVPQLSKAATASSPAFVMPSYETVTLANGLTLMLMPQTEVPLITVNAVVRSGSVNDTQAGLASMTAASLLLGNSLKSKAESELFVDSLGASVASYSSAEGSVVTMDFMANDAIKILPLLKAILITPSFDSAEFTKLKQQQIAALTQAKESPRAVIHDYFRAQVFGSHPYGNATDGDEQSLQPMTTEAVQQFHQQYYQPNNAAIIVAGDFDLTTMKDYLTGLFADWQGGSTNVSSNVSANANVSLVAAPAALTQARVLVVDKADAIETTFMIGGLGISRNNPDYVSLQVINTILGGRFTSWLNDELRVNSGLTYGARSGFSPYRDSGLFSISTFTKTASTEQAIDLALATYAKLWQQGLDQATLDSAKSYVKGQFPPEYETSGQLANLMSTMYLYGVDDSFINNFEAQVNNLDLAEAASLIKRYFPQQHLQLVLIGKADEIEAMAAKYGKVKRISIDDVGFSH
ncbi:insulinase family protein [Shewanella sp. SNU WT4]|uniref:M16 family metallopeptidase n=1 Tax=Shewanella sp. SNU WT4 TaxID=2590015 RepID=UPI00112E41FF|nr:pitrilysin family protein [Shewanella sp. SNU WT4]QDF65776.1 insulinase family protein [Shewanella sp. SNU WT4]